MGKKIGAVRRQLEKRPIHHQLEHVLPADVDDECHLRVERRDVCKVLLRPHAKIDAVCPHDVLQPWNHQLKAQFIREEVFEAEVSAIFGKVRDHLPERLIGKRRWKRLRSASRKEETANQTNGSDKS